MAEPSRLTSAPLVSVIIAAYNAERYIRTTCLSVLNQTYSTIEIIVIDDGSTDRTAEIVQALADADPRIRLVRQANRGTAAARNRAIAEARGEFIAPVDADDLWHPTKLERQVRRLQACGPDTGMVYCWWTWIDGDDVVLDRSPRWLIEGHVAAKLIEVNFSGSTSVPVYRRKCIDAVGGYSVTFKEQGCPGCEDWDLAIRVAEQYAVSVVPAVLVGYRRRPNSMSAQYQTMWRSYGRVVSGVAERAPSIGPHVLRRSNEQFALYLAGVALWSGDFLHACQWGLRVRSFGLALGIFPHVVRTLLRRLTQAIGSPRMPSIANGWCDEADLLEPLIPYDRIYAKRWRSEHRDARPPLRSSGLVDTVESALRAPKMWALHAAHELLLARLRVETWLASRNANRPPSIVVTACWTFPIYSQTFVHQEACSLAQAGFSVRFLYSRRGPRADLADTCSPLWGFRRRVLTHAATGARDLAAFRRRMPEKVERLTAMIATASGLEPQDLERHEHFLHAFSFARAVEACAPAYIHSYFFYERTLFALVASYLLEIPRGVSCYADHMLHDYALKLVPLHLATCDVIVATSQRIRAELELLNGGALPGVVVKPNAIDTASFAAGPKRRSSSESVRLLSVSRLDPKKGLEYLIDAVRLLTDRGLNIEAQIIGSASVHQPGSPDYADALDHRVERLQLRGVVQFAGQLASPHIRSALQEADIFVAPSVEMPNGDKDGMPTAVLEAMAAGCAIVATSAGSIHEIINHGQEGLIVPQRDPTALAAAIELLARDKARAASLGAGAAAHARRDFDVATCETLLHDRVRGVIREGHPKLTLATAAR